MDIPAWHRHLRHDLDHRIELVSMDRYCEDITIALYAVQGDAVTIHSYSDRVDVPRRLAWLALAMQELGGTRAAGGDGRTVAFDCGARHELAMRRLFLEACKVDPSQSIAIRPMATNDARTGQYITVTSLGSGLYEVTAVAETLGADDRAPGVAAGLIKLAGLDPSPDEPTIVRFACGAPHDELVGLLLPRAINVRAALRELAQASGRGILVAPSAQEVPA